jgi:hypothetical protein
MDCTCSIEVITSLADVRNSYTLVLLVCLLAIAYYSLYTLRFGSAHFAESAWCFDP